MSPRSRSLASIIGATTYVLVLGAIAQFFIFPILHDQWIATIVQVLFYVVLALPFIFIEPKLLQLCRAPHRQLAVGLTLITAATLFALVQNDFNSTLVANNLLRQSFTGPIEELIFRGYIWQRSLQYTDNLVVAAVLNIVAFGVVHVPFIIAQQMNPLIMIAIAIIGFLLLLVRIKYKNVVL
ncbi:hypothetical protein CYG49_02335, partial [Candidatus Saccharibacteria bacterium]